MSAEIADVLERAADLIAPKGAWTRTIAARDSNDNEVPPYSPRAVCWCIEGAIAAVTRHKWASAAFEAEPACRFLKERLRNPYEWNDASRRTRAQVVAKLREIAAAARGEK